MVPGQGGEISLALTAPVSLTPGCGEVLLYEKVSAVMDHGGEKSRDEEAVTLPTTVTLDTVEGVATIPDYRHSRRGCSVTLTTDTGCTNGSCSLPAPQSSRLF